MQREREKLAVGILSNPSTPETRGTQIRQFWASQDYIHSERLPENEESNEQCGVR